MSQSIAEETDVWAELERLLNEKTPGCDSSSAQNQPDLNDSEPQGLGSDPGGRTPSLDEQSGSRVQPLRLCDDWLSEHHSSAPNPGASRRKQSRQFVIVDADDTQRRTECDAKSDTLPADGKSASSPPQSNYSPPSLETEAASRSPPPLSLTEGALSRCNTAVASPRRVPRSFTVQDLDSESVFTSLQTLGTPALTLRCASEEQAHGAKTRFQPSLAPHRAASCATQSVTQSALTPRSPHRRTDIEWAVDADPDALGCEDLRSAISLLQLRVRELEANP